MAIVLSKKEQGFTRYVCDTVPVHSASLGDTAIDNTTGIEYTYLSSGWVNSTIAEISQSQKIYVDSTYGLDSTGNGSIASPYLTPEFALSDITNTGTVTGDINTSVTITNISDVDNATLEVGMYLVGTGIPYGTVIISKGNEGGDANTIVISKSATSTTASLSITWYKAYTLVLNGDFVATGNWHKPAVFFDCGNSIISFGNLYLFSVTTKLEVPFNLKGGHYSGTHSLSRFISMSAANSTSVFNVDILSYHSIGTSYQINSNQNGQSKFGGFNLNCPDFNADFGYVADFEASSSTDVIVRGNYYGLLGGIRVRYLKFIFDGVMTTPSSIDAFVCTTSSTGMMISGLITGELSLASSYRSIINGTVNGTSHSIGSYINNGFSIINADFYGTLTTTGGVKFNGRTESATINVNNGIAIFECLTTNAGNDSITVNVTGGAEVTLKGSSNQSFNGFNTLSVDGNSTVTVMNNVRSINYNTYGNIPSISVTSGSKLNFHGFNYGAITNCAGEINIYNEFEHVNKSADITGTLNINNATFRLLRKQTESSTYTPTISISTGKVMVDGGSIICDLADSKSGLFRKTADTGQLIFKGQPYLKIANGLAPLQILSNTGTAQDVMNFGVITNGAVGFRLVDTFSDTTYGTTYAPNILVGGITYEDTTYDF